MPAENESVQAVRALMNRQRLALIFAANRPYMLLPVSKYRVQIVKLEMTTQQADSGGTFCTDQIAKLVPVSRHMSPAEAVDSISRLRKGELREPTMQETTDGLAGLIPVENPKDRLTFDTLLRYAYAGRYDPENGIAQLQRDVLDCYGTEHEDTFRSVRDLIPPYKGGGDTPTNERLAHYRHWVARVILCFCLVINRIV